MVIGFLLLLILFTDLMLYQKYWIKFSIRYYFMDYGIGVGWMMASKMRDNNG